MGFSAAVSICWTWDFGITSRPKELGERRTREAQRPACGSDATKLSALTTHRKPSAIIIAAPPSHTLKCEECGLSSKFGTAQCPPQSLPNGPSHLPLHHAFPASGPCAYRSWRRRARKDS